MKSVRQRVASLRELGLTADESVIRQAIISEFCDSSSILDAGAEAEICRIESEYLNPDFIYRGVL